MCTVPLNLFWVLDNSEPAYFKLLGHSSKYTEDPLVPPSFAAIVAPTCAFTQISGTSGHQGWFATTFACLNLWPWLASVITSASAPFIAIHVLPFPASSVTPPPSSSPSSSPVLSHVVVLFILFNLSCCWPVQPCNVIIILRPLLVNKVFVGGNFYIVIVVQSQLLVIVVCLTGCKGNRHHSQHQECECDFHPEEYLLPLYLLSQPFLL